MNDETGNRTAKNSPAYWRIKAISMGVAGLVFIMIYFFLVMGSPAVQLLRPVEGVSKEGILAKADSFYHQLGLPKDGTDNYKREAEAATDKYLFKYAQYFKKQTGKYPDLPIGYWTVMWRDPAYASVTRRYQSGVFEVTFDFKGNLTGFKAMKKHLKFDTAARKIEDEDDALWIAEHFLESLQIKAESLVIVNKDISQDNNNITTYRFTLKNKTDPYIYINETYSFEITGDRIISFKKETIVNRRSLGWSGDRNKLLGFIVLVIIWMVILLTVIVYFVKKLRRDELEFRHALWVGIFTAVQVAVIYGMTNFGNWMEILISSVFMGAVTLTGLLILHPVVSALSREIWPEKLEVVDLLFQGKGGVRETGTGLLRAFFLTGFTLALFGLYILVTTSADIGYLSLGNHLPGVFQDLRSAVITVLENLSVSVLIGLLFLAFWPAFLKYKIPNHPLISVLLLAISLDLAGLHLLFFEPTYLGAILGFPIALCWSYAIHKWDVFTIMVALTGTNFLSDLVLLFLVPGSFNSFQGIVAIILLLLFFGLGVFLLFSHRSAKDYDVYVPEYMNRIAERERFLKELEIARGVQMRFLPQKVPQSPSLEIVSICQPAMEVGGDYFDFIQMDNRYMTVLIGDVSGKGVSAAFYMTMVKGIIKTLSKKILDPATLLAEANEIFYENAPRDVFITIIYGIFDLQEKKLTIASAGHNPLIVWRYRTRKIEMINPRGVALGLARGEQYGSIIEDKSIPIDDKDIFVFYTDGVSEAMNSQDEVFGEDRLREVVERYAHLSPQQLQERIVEAVAYFSGKAPQHDDFTMVVVKVRPQ
ncbi:MAG: PP2C family protein-serine/threonine phosphatase [bacterium]|nr:PP2C family protein-serine/threonine phosphatase [bacterium]